CHVFALIVGHPRVTTINNNTHPPKPQLGLRRPLRFSGEVSTTFWQNSFELHVTGRCSSMEINCSYVFPWKVSSRYLTWLHRLPNLIVCDEYMVLQTEIYKKTTTSTLLAYFVMLKGTI
ncbi:hypothetical protein M8C21_027847, partial [Ambrosia artemisiifolia]